VALPLAAAAAVIVPARLTLRDPGLLPLAMVAVVSAVAAAGSVKMYRRSRISPAVH